MPRKNPNDIPAMKAKQWKKGESGNPKGRPPRKSLESYVEELLDKKFKGDKSGVTNMEILGKVIVDEMVTRRNTALMKTMMDRLWPAPKEVNVNGEVHLTYTIDEQDLEA